MNLTTTRSACMGEVADRFQGVGVPGVTELRELAHDRLFADERSRLGPTLRGARNHVGGKTVGPSVHVSCVPRLEPGAHDLHVLLRHRPRSIALAQESA